MQTVESNMVGSMPPKSDIDTSTYSGRIAARLRSLREAKGWTVKELTARINKANPPRSVAQSTVHAWDSNRHKVDPDYIPAIARVFRLTIRSFLPIT